MSRDLVGLDVIVGDDMFIGAYDLGVWRRQMDALKQVPVAVALVLQKFGQQAIDYANKSAAMVDLAHASIPFAEKLPGATRRAEVTGKLRWHKDTLAKLAPTTVELALNAGNPAALKVSADKMAATYASGSDLKEWVLQAFIEANAVQEGVAALSSAWDDMWKEIIEALKKLPADIAKKAGDIVKEVAWYGKAVVWLGIGGGLIVLGLAGWGIGAGLKQRISSK